MAKRKACKKCKLIITGNECPLCKSTDLTTNVKGRIIVTDVDKFMTKTLPELDKLSPNEIKVLHTAFQLKKFTEEDMIKKGLLLDVKEGIKSLVEKNYLDEKDNKFEVSENYV